MNTQPSCTVHIVGGDCFFHALNKAESLKGEAGSLLLAIDSHHCLTIPITPGRNILTDKVKFCPVCQSWWADFSLARIQNFIRIYYDFALIRHLQLIIKTKDATNLSFLKWIFLSLSERWTLLNIKQVKCEMYIQRLSPSKHYLGSGHVSHKNSPNKKIMKCGVGVKGQSCGITSI